MILVGPNCRCGIGLRVREVVKLFPGRVAAVPLRFAHEPPAALGRLFHRVGRISG
jgi:hypothetical protein